MSARRAARVVVAAVLAVGATAGLVALSGVPLASSLGPDEGMVRLSWRLRGEAGESACRLPTPEELERLPAHMRDPDACMGRGASWRLSVRIAGTSLVSDTLEPAGARGDRPVFVLRELIVPAGTHLLEVAFEPVGGSAASGHRLRQAVDVLPGEVVLVTWESEAERLVLRGG